MDNHSNFSVLPFGKYKALKKNEFHVNITGHIDVTKNKIMTCKISDEQTLS